MPLTSTFYSKNEVKKEEKHRVHHNNSACGPGKQILDADKLYGPMYRLCDDCIALNAEGK